MPGDETLNIELGPQKSLAALEVMEILKSSEKASKLKWTVVRDCEKKESLRKLFEEVKVLLLAANILFPQIKTLNLVGDSEIEWDFWADVFIQYFPNLETLCFDGSNDGTANFIRKLGEMGKFEALRGIKTKSESKEEIWCLFLEKSCQVTEIELWINPGELTPMNLFLKKYRNQLERVRFNFYLNFDQIRIPPMEKLLSLDLFWNNGRMLVHQEQVNFSKDENAYPNLKELKLGAFDIDIVMDCFMRNAERGGLSQGLKSVTAGYLMNEAARFNWTHFEKDKDVLRMLKHLFPNAKAHMDYGQLDEESKKKGCLIV